MRFLYSQNYVAPNPTNEKAPVSWVHDRIHAQQLHAHKNPSKQSTRIETEVGKTHTTTMSTDKKEEAPVAIIRQRLAQVLLQQVGPDTQSTEALQTVVEDVSVGLQVPRHPMPKSMGLGWGTAPRAPRNEIWVSKIATHQ